MARAARRRTCSGSQFAARVDPRGADIRRRLRILETDPRRGPVYITSATAVWFDATVGASRVMFKAKDSAGTVVTGSVALT